MDLTGEMSHHLAWYKMGIGTMIVFKLAIVMIRIGGGRTFGKDTTIDVIVGVILAEY